MYNYKIKESREKLEDSIIEKSGISVDFTIGDINEEQKALEKYIKEFKANLEVKEAAIANIEEFHPFVKDFDEEKLFTIAFYAQNKKAEKEYQEKIDEFTKQLEGSRAEVLEIIKQIGINTEQVTASEPDEESNAVTSNE